MTHVYRCTHNNCRKRVILAYRLNHYIRKPKCPCCKRELTGSVDRALIAQRRREVCGCDGYHFPHRRGSKWCQLSTRPITDADYAERYRVAA